MKQLLIGLGIAAGIWVVFVAGLAIAGRRSAARELVTLVPNLAILFKRLMQDARVPRRSKVLIGFAAAWMASPIDLIPEFVPIAGPLDDVVVAALVLRHLLRSSDAAVVREHWRGDPAILERIIGRGRRI